MPRNYYPWLAAASLCAVGVLVWKTGVPGADTSPAIPRAEAHRPPAVRSVSPPTRLDFIRDTGQPYQVRISLLRSKLATGCTEPEIRFLYQLLEEAPPKSELAEHWFVIANDIMTRLLAFETDPSRFTTKFTGILMNASQPGVIRDYAVQHLAAWLNPRSSRNTISNLAPPSPALAEEVLQSLVAATMDAGLEQTTVPGTTLMMLVDIIRSGSEVDCTKAVATLKPWLFKALQEGSTLENSTRVSAVSAAGVLAPADFRPLIRRIAYQENGGSSLRLPAVAALGQTGEAEDLERLRQIASTHPELAYAARDAAEALAVRLNPEFSPSGSR